MISIQPVEQTMVNIVKYTFICAFDTLEYLLPENYVLNFCYINQSRNYSIGGLVKSPFGGGALLTVRERNTVVRIMVTGQPSSTLPSLDMNALCKNIINLDWDLFKMTCLSHRR